MMPSGVNSDSSDEESSPSLLKSLNRFEYRKSQTAKKPTKGVRYSDSEHSTGAQDDTAEKPFVSEDDDDDEKEPVDAVLNGLAGVAQDDGCKVDTKQDSPVVRTRINKVKRRICSDSENEDSFETNAQKKSRLGGTNSEEGVIKEVSEDELFNDKERCLKILMDIFPKVDLTALSDILLRANWDVESAISMFRDEERHRKEASTVQNGNVSQKNVKREGLNIVRLISTESNSKIVHGKTHELSDAEEDGGGGEGTVLRHDTHTLSDSDDEERPSSKPQTSKSMTSRNRLNVKTSTHRKKKDVVAEIDCEDYAHGDESSSDSDKSDIDDTLTPARAALLELLSDGTLPELVNIPGCSKKKAEAIIQLRPFDGWADLVRKFQASRQLSRDLLTKAKDVIYTRNVMKKLMKECERISLEMEAVMNSLLDDGAAKKSYIGKQPALLNDKMKLAPYQLIGLNWLYIMHKQELNGILADEMGLGKTIQAIAFLAYLHQTKERSHHLIVVPSSTLDNWLQEFFLWCPTINVLCYHGSQDERKELRLQLVNDEVDWDVMITTYNMVSSSLEDRGLFRRLRFHYVIFDEAHMLKNMASQRYQNLMRIVAKRRLLLTGTPLQNNLVELMSLLIFVMPGMFHDKIEQVKHMFSSVSKLENDRSKYERERIQHAKRIMKPFVLRRLKSEVLQQLPKKHEETLICPLSSTQQEKYETLVTELSKKVKEEKNFKGTGVGMMMMELRKAANHPLLIRRIYQDTELRKMSNLMLNEPTHQDSNPQLIFEDMQVMSDFELHRLCKIYRSVSSFQLEETHVLDSGKFKVLDDLLKKKKENDSRILLFSQFTMMLDIIEEYMMIRRHKYLRLDGSTPVQDRQELIDKFNQDQSIFIFILSTKAGGLGINLTAANVVVIHDIDFNPYNDKQAEDRCHRVGQTRDVFVNRLISKSTIEEGMLQVAQEKLRLEKDITMEEGKDEEDIKCVTTLLKQALGM